MTLNDANRRTTMPATLIKTAAELVRDDLAFSTVHGKLVRFVRWDCGLAVVANRNTGRELPDLVHPSQLQPK
jgi:hypothetical protein